MEINKDINYHNRVQYLKIYEYLIKKALYYEIFNGYSKEEYLETHHILPKCMGGTNNSSNLVKVSARTHIILHMLLEKMYPENKYLSKAVFMCMFSGKGNGKTKRREACDTISTKLIADARENFRRSRYIKVVCFLENFKVIRVYDNIKDVESDGFSRTAVSSVCNNHRKTHCGYYWMKYEDFEKEHLSELEEFYSNEILPNLNTKYISESTEYKRKNKTITNETRTILSKISTGKKMSDETKKKISDKNKSNNNLMNKKGIILEAPNGKIYKSIRECAKDLNLSPRTVKKRLDNNSAGFKVINNDYSQTRKVLNESSGKIYNSINECILDLNISRDCFYRWIKNPEKKLKLI